MHRKRTIRFEKVKTPDEKDINKFWTINEGSLQDIIIKLCDKYHMQLKTIIIEGVKCKVKMYANKEQVQDFVYDMMVNYNHYVKNFKY